MKLRTGIALSREAADLVVVSGRKIVAEAHVARTDGAVRVLRELLKALPAEYRRTPISLGVSAGDLAASERARLPDGIRDRTLQSVAPALAESHAAGQAVEDLSADVVRSGEWLHVAAMRTECLSEIQKLFATEKLPLRLVTPLPVAIAALGPKEPLLLVHGGEATAVDADGKWRSHPSDEDRSSSGPLPDSPERTGALATALLDPDRSPNLLRGMPDAPRSIGRRFRAAFLSIGVAAAALLAAVGFLLRAETNRVESEIAAGEREELRMWSEYLPDERPIPGLLIRIMGETLATRGPSSAKNDTPSALEFLSDLGGALPDPDRLGLTLEALDLSPEGGRIAGTVTADPRDPLKHAAQLEAALDAAPRIVARGDYETRGDQIQVRLRMDFSEKPKSKSGRVK